MNTIVSKRTSPFTYQKWAFTNGQYFPEGPGIMINGGAGVVGGLELLSGRPLAQRSSIIPVGVHTYVDDDILAKLMTIPKFLKDIERGIITVIKGEQCDQDRTDEIADKDMIPDEHIPTRPITYTEMQNAGAKINKDGSVNIDEVDEMDTPLRQRKIEAGLPEYSKKALRESKKADAALRSKARTPKKKRG